MKIAFISDIHSNYDFFEICLKEIDKIGCDRIFCLGDLVGYYGKPELVIQECIKRNITSIKGNHEAYLLGEVEYDTSKEHIYSIIEHKKIISESSFEYIRNMKEEIELDVCGKKVLLSHAYPGDICKYMYNPLDIPVNIVNDYDYYVSGHTHVPYIHYYRGLCLVNPGSVGQPRDYTAKPSFGIVDFESNVASIKKVDVDLKSIINELKSVGIENSLVEILKRGVYDN